MSRSTRTILDDRTASKLDSKISPLAAVHRQRPRSNQVDESETRHHWRKAGRWRPNRVDRRNDRGMNLARQLRNRAL